MATYHINYLTGSNATGDGTAGNPYATILYAMQTHSPANGDEIKVAGSGITDIDTNATLAAETSTIFNTSVDLTSQVAVGDFVVLSPKYAPAPELDNYVQYRVTAITSTQLTIRANIHWPLISLSNSWTISKLNSFVSTTTTGTFEDLSAVVNNNISITGGWNDTFTSIIGITRIIRTGLAAGSTSGTAFNLRSNHNIENFAFYQFTNAFIGVNFQDIFKGDNLKIIDTTNLLSIANTSIRLITGKNVVNIDFVNSSANFQVIFGNGGVVVPKIINYGRTANVQNSYIKDPVLWTTTAAGDFASFYMLGSPMIYGTLTMLDVTIANGWPSIVGNNGGNIQVIADDIKWLSTKTKITLRLVHIEGTPYYFEFKNKNILTDFELLDQRPDATTFMQPRGILRDMTGKVFNMYNNILVSEDTDIYQTGSSSKRIVMPLNTFNGRSIVPIVSARLSLNNKRLKHIKIKLRTTSSQTVRWTRPFAIGPRFNATGTTNTDLILNTNGNWVEYVWDAHWVSTPTDIFWNTSAAQSIQVLAFDVIARSGDRTIWIDDITLEYEL